MTSSARSARCSTAWKWPPPTPASPRRRCSSPPKRRARSPPGCVWNVDAPLDIADLSQLADGLPNRFRLQLDLSDLGAGTLAPGDGRLLLVALMMAAEALHGRGTIVLAGDPASEVMIVIDGLRAAWAIELPSLLADPPSCWFNLDSRDLSTPLAVLLAAAAGANVSLLLSSGPTTGPPPLMLSFKH
jgi:hypothetical protein